MSVEMGSPVMLIVLMPTVSPEHSPTARIGRSESGSSAELAYESLTGGADLSATERENRERERTECFSNF